VRLGWAAGPPEIVAKLVWAKQNTDQCSGALGQRLLEEYGRRGHLDAKIAEARRLYAHRAERTMEALAELMPPEIVWTRPSGGFYTWLTLPTGLDTTELAKRAMQERVAFVPGAPFYPDGAGRESLRISFSRAGDDDILEGMRRLGRLFSDAVYGGRAA
jgi:2-aminoadipate transaminase